MIENEKEIRNKIIRILKNKDIRTINELIIEIQKEISVSTNRLIQVIKKLDKNNLLLISNKKNENNNFFKSNSFLINKKSLFYYINLSFIIIYYIFIFYLPENALQSGNILYIFLGVLRFILGTIITLFLSGYCILSIFFSENSEFGIIEKYLLSVIISIAILIIIGFILNFTPFGITYISVSLVLNSLNLILICISIILYIKKLYLKNN